MAAGSKEQPSLTDWRAVAVIVAAGVVAALQVGKGIIALPALRVDFALGLNAAGWPAAAWPVALAALLALLLTALLRAFPSMRRA